MLEMGFQKHVETIIQNVKYPGEDSKQAAYQALKDDDDKSRSSRSRIGGYSKDGSSSSSRFVQSRQLPSNSDDEYDDVGNDRRIKSSINSNNNKVKQNNIQMLLFSATMSTWIYNIITKHMINPVLLDATPNNDGEMTHLPESIHHLCMPYPLTGKSRLQSIISAIYDLTLLFGSKHGGQTLVFTNTKVEADQILASDLLNGKSDQKYMMIMKKHVDDERDNNHDISIEYDDGGDKDDQRQPTSTFSLSSTISTTTTTTRKTTTTTDTSSSSSTTTYPSSRLSLQPRTLHGGMTQHSRQRTIQDFKDGKFQLLIATDIASRGLDVKDVDLIIQTQLPDDYDTFVHRVGRTGRAGRNGTSILLYNNGDSKYKSTNSNRQSSSSSSSSSSSGSSSSSSKSSSSAVDFQKQLTKDQQRIIEFEHALNIKLHSIDPYTKSNILDALNNYQQRRFDRLQQKQQPRYHQQQTYQQQQPSNQEKNSEAYKSSFIISDINTEVQIPLITPDKLTGTQISDKPTRLSLFKSLKKRIVLENNNDNNIGSSSRSSSSSSSNVDNTNTNDDDDDDDDDDDTVENNRNSKSLLYTNIYGSDDSDYTFNDENDGYDDDDDVVDIDKGIKGLQWKGTEDPDELRRVQNDILREKYRIEQSSGVMSDMSTMDRERAKLLLDRSAKKKDKRAEYYKKVKLEKEKALNSF